MQDRDILTMED